MRTLLVLIGLALLPALAGAQETYSADAVADLDAARLAENRWTCRSAGLTDACTPAQLAAAKPGAVLHPNTRAGREDVARLIAQRALKARQKDIASDRRRLACEAWAAMSEADRTTACAANDPRCDHCP